MYHSFVLLAALLGTAAGGGPAAKMPDTSKMNILLIDIEDTNPNAIGCYGNPIPKTPQLDRFASTAVRFDSAYCQAFCCNPTRTSFLTGMRPLTTRVFSNSDVMNDHLPPGTGTLPEMFKDAGFYTAVIGKLFHQADYAERQLATFDRIEMYGKPKGWKGPEPILQFPPVQKSAERDPPPADRKSKEYRQWRVRQSDRYGDSGLTREQEHDYRMAQTAVALLKEFARNKRQFFLALAQSRPHTPLVAPKQYIDMYHPADIPDPPAPPQSLRNFPYMERATGSNPDIFTKQQPSKQQAREAIAAYYACMSFVDDNIGIVLEALQQEGLAGNTIVVFLGDHGFHLGDHGFWSKYSMLEGTRRVALMVRVPGAPANGKVCREFVEFVDLVPTLGELVHLNLPKNLEGTSFVPLLVNPQQAWKKAVFLVDGSGGQVVRTRKCSYMEFKKGTMPAALFDLARDPWETINVVDDPAYAAARKEMADLLHAGWQAALP
jgi:uncharacterized sulfatase